MSIDQPAGFRWTRWPSLTNTYGQVIETWPPFAEELGAPLVVTAKEQLPGFSPGLFQNNHRAKPDALEMYGIGLDYDGEKIPLARAVAAISPYRCVAYTTFKHTPDTPRYRLLVPFTRPVSPAEFSSLWARFRDVLGQAGIEIDEGCKDPSRLWFAPGVGGEGAPYEGGEFGETICNPDLFLGVPEDDAPDHPDDAPPPSQARHLRLVASPLRDRIGEFLEKGAAEIRFTPPDSGRNNALNKWSHAAGGLSATGLYDLPRERAWAEFSPAALAAGLTPEETEKTFESGWSSGLLKPWYLDGDGPGGIGTVERKNPPRAPAEGDGDGAEEAAARKSAATILVELALGAGIDLWYADAKRKEKYATVPAVDHREHYPLDSSDFEEWLIDLHTDARGFAVGGQGLKDAVATLAAKCRRKGQRHPAYLRTGESGGRFYLDLFDDRWKAVEVDAGGWRVVECPEARFYRMGEGEELEEPKRGGSIEELRKYLNAPGEEEWAFLVAWILAALRPRGPFPILVLGGEQGSAKSTTAKIARSLVDPNSASLRDTPKDKSDLRVAAYNSWVLNFDNLSGIEPWLSDALCRLSTGGGLATRKLYENMEEVVFHGQRPIIVNGIDDVATRGDLADRSLIVNLPRISEKARRTEEDVWAEFTERRPYILGAFLDSVSIGLKNLPTTHRDQWPRMADFAKWVTACEPALPWKPGRFLELYSGSRKEVSESSIEDDPFGEAVRAFALTESRWEGTPSELLKALVEAAKKKENEAVTRRKEWPRTPIALGSRLKRLGPALRGADVRLEWLRSGGRRRVLLGCARCYDPTNFQQWKTVGTVGTDGTNLTTPDAYPVPTLEKQVGTPPHEESAHPAQDDRGYPEDWDEGEGEV